MSAQTYVDTNEGNHEDSSQFGETYVEGDESKDNAANEKKKRDRWSKAPDSEACDGDGAKDGDSTKKKSRWGTKQEEIPQNLAIVPFRSTGSIVPYGGLTSAVTPFGSQLGTMNSDQVKVQIRIAEIQSLYGRPRLQLYQRQH